MWRIVTKWRIKISRKSLLTFEPSGAVICILYLFPIWMTELPSGLAGMVSVNTPNWSFCATYCPLSQLLNSPKRERACAEGAHSRYLTSPLSLICKPNCLYDSATACKPPSPSKERSHSSYFCWRSRMSPSNSARYGSSTSTWSRKALLFCGDTYLVSSVGAVDLPSSAYNPRASAKTSSSLRSPSSA